MLWDSIDLTKKSAVTGSLNNIIPVLYSLGHHHLKPWWVFRWRGTRCPDTRLSLHYIGQKMTKCYFSNLCRKKIAWLDKKSLLHSLNDFVDFANYNNQSHPKRCRTFLKLFSAEILEIICQHFWANIMSKQPRVHASSASHAEK